MRREIAAGLFAVGLASAGAATAQGLLPWQDSAAVDRGAKLYDDHCAACHGADLAGEPDWQTPKPSGRLPAPPHDASGHTWHHPDKVLFRITKYGTEVIVGGDYRSDMSGFGELLSDDQILEVLGYIKSTWPRRVIETHERINAAAGAPPQ